MSIEVRRATRAFGAFHACLGLASLPASVIFGFLWTSLGQRAAFLTGAGVAGAAAVALYALRGTIQPAPER